jgi:ferritin-like metal-binding protein YciE
LPGSEARDTGLIMAGLKTENYEITSYNGLIQLAAQLGHNDVADILRQILEDEIEADEILSSIGKNNPKPASKKNK